MFESLKWLLGRRERPRLIYECRRCGETVDGETDACPQCGHGRISEYEIY